MRFQDLREAIRRSSRGDWHKITCWGGGAGPSYRDRLTTGTINGDLVEYESHGNVAVFMPDIDISIAWGLDRDPDDRHHGLSFEWDDKFPDSKTTVQLADIFYRGSLVDREYQAAVDGGRALIPMGHTRIAEGSPRHGKDVRYEVVTSEWQVDFARVVHSFEHAGDFDGYLSSAQCLRRGWTAPPRGVRRLAGRPTTPGRLPRNQPGRGPPPRRADPGHVRVVPDPRGRPARGGRRGCGVSTSCPGSRPTASPTAGPKRSLSGALSGLCPT